MSFFSGNRQGCNPGPIQGNPLSGLCEKACTKGKAIYSRNLDTSVSVRSLTLVSGFTPVAARISLAVEGPIP